MHTELPPHRTVFAEDILAKEVVDLRASIDQHPGEVAVWRRCLEGSLAANGIRELSTDKLIGIGVLAGNVRHAHICDLAVRKKYWGAPVGTTIVRNLMKRASVLEIESLTLHYQPETGVDYDALVGQMGFSGDTNLLRLT